MGNVGGGRAEASGVTAGGGRALARSASSRASRLDPAGRRSLTRIFLAGGGCLIANLVCILGKAKAPFFNDRIPLREADPPLTKPSHVAQKLTQRPQV